MTLKTYLLVTSFAMFALTANVSHAEELQATEVTAEEQAVNMLEAHFNFETPADTAELESTICSPLGSSTVCHGDGGSSICSKLGSSTVCSGGSHGSTICSPLGGSTVCHGSGGSTICSPLGSSTVCHGPGGSKICSKVGSSTICH